MIPLVVVVLLRQASSDKVVVVTQRQPTWLGTRCDWLLHIEKSVASESKAIANGRNMKKLLPQKK